MLLGRLYPEDQIAKYFIIDAFAIAYLFYQVFLADGSSDLVVRIILFLLLLVCHYIALWYRDWRLLAASLAGCALLVALTMHVTDWMILVYGFVFADLLGRATRRSVMATGMVGIAAMYVLHGWIMEGNPWAFLTTEMTFPVMIAQLATPIVVHTREKAGKLKQKLDIANAQLARYIQEEERHRIARDLHDTLGQTLMMIKMKSELTMRLVEKDPVQAKDELQDILSTSRHALKQVRELVSDMKFVSLQQEIERSGDMLHNAGIALSVQGSIAMNPLSNVAETMVALCVREAVTNIVKHSGATKCDIRQGIEPERFWIQVKDNGNGGLKPGEGNGLQSMKERMEMLQGELRITASPDSGTAITFDVPLTSNGRR